jgi:SAM-dependent methyltransferase
VTRDTDRDWNLIAEVHPYFGVVALPRLMQPSELDLEWFFASGEEDVSRFLTIIRHDFPDFVPTSVLDFGCGVGRLLIPLAKHCGRGVGVDVADRMLALARDHIARAQVNATVQKDIPSEQFDWVNTFIVLQHVPPERGYDYIRRLWAATKLGGVFSPHITIFKDRNEMHQMESMIDRYAFDGRSASLVELRDGEPGRMSMFDYDLTRVMSILNLSSGQLFRTQYTTHGGCHGVQLFVRKVG